MNFMLYNYMAYEAIQYNYVFPIYIYINVYELSRSEH